MLYEITTLPERRNGLLYVEYVGWESSEDKTRMTARGYQPQPGDVGVLLRHGKRAGQLIYGHFANDHKMQLPDTSQRIKTVGTGSSMRLLLRDGSQVNPVDLSDATRLKIEQVGFDRETFARQVSTELTANIEAWLSREQNRKLGGNRDRRGRMYAKRDARGTTLNLQVAANDDDATQQLSDANSTRDVTISPIQSGLTDAGRTAFGGRVLGMPPSGVTVDACVAQFNVLFFGDDMQADLYFHLHTDSPDFATSTTVTGRTKTTATVAWVSLNLGTGWKTSPSLVAPLQEVIDNTGYAANAATVIAIGQNAATQAAYVSHYDGGSANAMKLDIDYTAATAANRRRRLLMACG